MNILQHRDAEGYASDPENPPKAKRQRQILLEARMNQSRARLEILGWQRDRLRVRPDYTLENDTPKAVQDRGRFQDRVAQALERETAVMDRLLHEWLTLDEEIDGAEAFQGRATAC